MMQTVFSVVVGSCQMGAGWTGLLSQGLLTLRTV